MKTKMLYLKCAIPATVTLVA